ncbi:MAG: ubiquinone biosynthesis hydroxylase [marine bacterium B5-7]|nr:MAG: ubiquinone biosynthesis hydroxylase [marine bacterium B5-7]
MKYDVVIVGAGPAGLSFARSLADTDLNVLIIEKTSEESLADPATDGRDIALTHLSVKLLNEIGVWSQIPSDAISPIKEARVLDGTSSYFLHFEQKKVSHDALGYLVSNHLIRKALYEKLGTLSNIELLPDTSVLSVNSNNQGASVTLSNGETIEATLVVAADSRFSETRRKVGLSASMRDFGQIVLVCRMEHERSHGNIAYECFHYGRTLAVLPLTGNQSSIVITAPTDRCNEILNLSEEEFNNDISHQFKGRLGKMKLIGERFPYPLIAVYADKFVSNHFALIGDAAVGMHPVTAHGFNLGLKGQHTLAREIKTALKRGVDIGSSTVLESYHSKHRRASHPLYLATNGIVRLYNNNEMLSARMLRKTMLRLGNNIWPVKRAIMNQLTAIEH